MVKKESTRKEKTNIRLRKETYGDIPLDECIEKALDPYFNPERYECPYLKNIKRIDCDRN